MNRARRQGGLTFIELLVTLAIAAILLTVAVPGFQEFIRNSRVSSQTNDFALALMYAKSEAVKRGSTVSVCSSSTGTSCANSTSWEQGWIVFANPNGDGTLDAGDTVLQVRPTLEGNNTLRAAARTRVNFQNTGFSSGFNDTFNICDTRGAAKGRTITLSNQGRVTIATPASSCP